MRQPSKLYSTLFPEELMLQTFGTTMPSQSKKNEYFFDCWLAWKTNEVRISSPITPTSFKNSAKEICHRMGLKEFWDYQTRGYSIRFKDADMKAFFKIYASDLWTI